MRAPRIIAAALAREDEIDEAAQRLAVGVDGATRLSDEELVSALWEAVRVLVPGDSASDYFYSLIREACERWAPDAEWAVNLRERQETHDDEEGELESDREGRDNRRAMREEVVR